MGVIERPQVCEIAPKTYMINEFGIGVQFVVVGEERALLIDTGTGLYDIKQMMARLTDKPYDVVITHNHPDHNGGSDQFEEVWMHHADLSYGLPERENAVRWKALRMEEMSQANRAKSIENGDPWMDYDHIWPYETVDKFPTTGKCKYLDLQDGQVFDLGGRHLVVYYTPGHTPGSCCLLDRERRILFSGDAMNFNVGTRSVGGPFSGVAVSTMLKGLLRIQAIESEFDQTFTGHCVYANAIDLFSQDHTVLDDIIENLRRILNGTANVIQRESHLVPGLIMPTAMYGQAATIFDADRLWEENEEHIIP